MQRPREGLLRVRNHHRSEAGFQKQWCSLGEKEFKIGSNSVFMGNAQVRKTTSRTLDVEDDSMNARFTLQLSSENELNGWFEELSRVAGSTLGTRVAPVELQRSLTYRRVKSEPVVLVELVRKQNESNYKCCDCNSDESVEWISINLLCVVCIKCSGVHRSLGSHISKIRSLTLDNFNSPEVLRLLRHNVSNSNVNSIFESKLSIGDKIRPFASDLERSTFIGDKYKGKIWVDEMVFDVGKSFKSLLKSIHLNSIYMLQRCLAQSKCLLREIVQAQSSMGIDEQQLPTAFRYSLKHPDMVHGHPVYYITEFLLLNGLPVEDFPVDCSNLSHPMYKYWRKRFDIYGTWMPIQSNGDNSNAANISSLSSFSNSSPSEDKNSSSNKRWSLNPIPNTAQVIMAPTNLLTAHKSLRLSRKGHSTGSNRNSTCG